MEIPSSIEQDIAELEKVLGCPIGLRVEEGLIFEKLGLSESAVDLSYFIFSVDNGLVVAECGYQSTSISKNDGGIYNIKKAPGINVTPEYKKLMEQYSFDKGQKKLFFGMGIILELSLLLCWF